MLEEIERVRSGAELLYGEQAVEAALDTMATAINRQLQGVNLLVLCAVNGGIVVAGKLLTRLHMPLNLDSINASRYQNQTNGGDVAWLAVPATPLSGRTVLIVDDVLDAGITLAAVHNYCLAQGADSVYSAVLIDKMLSVAKPIAADFVGLQTPDRYLFGYGMDYKGYLRNVAGIYACQETGKMP